MASILASFKRVKQCTSSLLCSRRAAWQSSVSMGVLCRLGGCLLAALLLCSTALAGPIINSVNTDLARYTPGSNATIYVNLANWTGASASGYVGINLSHLGVQQASLSSQNFNLTNGATTTLTFTWTTPSSDLTGYSVEISAFNTAGELLDSMNSAIDVSSSWTTFPRYGYLGSYPSQSSSTSYHDLWLLKNYHIDGVQFYDWQWKHHVPLAGTVTNPAASWTRIDNETNYAQTVKDYISAAHSYAMAAMSYNLIYGAWAGYGQDGSGVNYQWGLWTQNNGTNQWNISMPSGWATSNIYIFDPGNSGWQSYIYGQEANAFAVYGFDGWQADQLGNWNTMYSWSGNSVNYGAEVPGFLSGAKTALNKTIVYNAVAGFGIPTVLNSEDFAYVECWPTANGGTQNTYNDLKSVVDSIETASPGKGAVLPAYMDYNYGANNPGNWFNTPGVLLTESTIFSSGAAHLELGAGIGGNATLDMLDTAFFPNTNLTPTPMLLNTLQTYYDFDVEFENLVRAGYSNSSNTISMSVASSNTATANEVWAFAKDNGNVHLLSFINLIGESSINWRDDNGNYPVPTPQSNITVKYYDGSGAVGSVYWATPDANNGRMISIPYSTGSDSGGSYVSFTLPILNYWDFVYISPNSAGSVPSTPTGVMAAAGNTQVKISWTPATGISYNLYRSTASGGEGSVPYLTGVTPPYTDTNLNNGTTYYYTVAAVNSSGTSSQSAQVSAQPGNIPPANRKVALLSVAQMMRYSR